MSPKLVFHAKDVMPFSPAGAEAAFESRLLIDASGVGSTDLAVNHFTLKPGHSTDPGAHPKPYDEVYYVLRGSGRVSLGHPPEHTEQYCLPERDPKGNRPDGNERRERRENHPQRMPRRMGDSQTRARRREFG